MESQFLDMVTRSQIGNTSEYPEACSESCKHHQCPYHREENYGKACLNRVKTNEQLKNPSTELDQNRILTHEELMQKFQRDLEKALQPISDTAKRIERLEQRILNEPDFHSPAYSTNIKPFNYEGVTLFPRIDIGTNQSRIRETKQND